MLRWKDKKLDQVSGGKIAKHGVTYGILFLAMAAMTFFGVCDPSMQGPGGGMNLSGDAAQVGDQDISGMEFRRAYQDAYARYQKQFSENFDPAAFQLSKMVMNQLVNERVIYSMALNSGIAASDEEVEKVIADAEVFKDEKGKFDPQRFDQFLRSQRFSEKDFAEDVRRNLTTEKFRRFVSETYRTSAKAAEWRYKLSETKYDVEFLKIDPKTVKVTVSEEDVKTFLADPKSKDKIKQYYDRNKNDYNTEKKVKASHVLVSFTGARNASGAAATRTKEQAKKMAQDIVAEAKKGADFAALAKKHTDDPSGKTNGGDLGFFSEDAMVKEFSDAAFKMKKGEVSDVVESPFGFHVIKVADIQEAKKTPVEAASPEIARKILQDEKKPELLANNSKQIVAQLKEGKDVSALLKANDLKWDSTGLFALSATSIPKLGSNKELKNAVYALNKNTRLYPEPLEADGNYYVLRLKDRQDADMSKFDKSKKEELAKSASFMDAYGVFNTIASAAQKNYQDKGKIWVNEEYRDLDLNRAPADAQGG